MKRISRTHWKHLFFLVISSVSIIFIGFQTHNFCLPLDFGANFIFSSLKQWTKHSFELVFYWMQRGNSWYQPLIGLYWSIMWYSLDILADRYGFQRKTSDSRKSFHQKINIMLSIMRWIVGCRAILMQCSRACSSFWLMPSIDTSSCDELPYVNLRFLFVLHIFFSLPLSHRDNRSHSTVFRWFLRYIFRFTALTKA